MQGWVLSIMDFSFAFCDSKPRDSGTDTWQSEVVGAGGRRRWEQGSP